MKSYLSFFFTLFFSVFQIFGQSSHPDLISADELFKTIHQYQIIDVSKAESFAKQHISKAKNVWRPDIINSDAAYGGLIASEVQMERLMRNLGIHSSEKIVVYDHKGGCDAGRLWWILKQYGHKDVYLLDGGLHTWGKRGQKMKAARKEEVLPTKYSFPKTGKNPSLNISLEEVKIALNDTNTVILDTRMLDEYNGKRQKEGAFRAGRIPGSIHFDWVSNINYHGDQTILAKDSLLKLYNAIGVSKNKNIITYCHSGVRSAHTTFVLTEILGFKNVRNYDGSWIEWSFHKELPIATGAHTPPTIENNKPKSIEEKTTVKDETYGAVFWGSFKNFTNYTWNEITCKVSPWYVNYFWLLVVLSLFVWLLEIIFPWRKDQAIIRKDFWMDAFFMFFNFYIFKIIIFMAFSNVTAKFFHDIIGGDSSSFALIDMSSFPLFLQLIIFFIATDFIQWFTHVLLHRFEFFWRFHKVHHSVEQMGFAAHLRYHWMENVFYTPMKYIMVMLIGGFTPEMAYIVFYISIAIGHFNHANIGLSYGPLKYLINNPKMHIWHHAKQLPHERRYGVNFGISLSIWDYIFGTNYIPSDGKDIPLGFTNMERYPKGFFGLIFSGFKKTPDEK